MNQKFGYQFYGLLIHHHSPCSFETLTPRNCPTMRWTSSPEAFQNEQRLPLKKTSMFKGDMFGTKFTHKIRKIQILIYLDDPDILPSSSSGLLHIYIYKFGLTPHPATVTNEGLGWDSLLKME